LSIRGNLLVGCHDDFEGPLFPLSQWEKVRVRGFFKSYKNLALARWARAKAQQDSSITFTVTEY